VADGLDVVAVGILHEPGRSSWQHTWAGAGLAIVRAPAGEQQRKMLSGSTILRRECNMTGRALASPNHKPARL